MDIKIEKNGKVGNIRLYRTFCQTCGTDRGYKRKREANRNCRHCSNLSKYKYNNIATSDYITIGTGANTRRAYKSTCLQCGKDRGYKTISCAKKICYSCTMKNKWKTDSMRNLNPTRVFNYTKEGGVVKFKSSYELAYAIYLDTNDIKWIYEPHFQLSDGSNFYPDFELEDGTIVEIKGYFREDAKIKWQLFDKDYPNIKKCLLMKSHLKSMGVL